MPLVQPADNLILGIEDRIRALLAADATLTGIYTTPIREYPVLGVASADEVLVSIDTPDADVRPVELNQPARPITYAPRLILTVAVYEPPADEVVSGRHGQQVVKSYQRLWNVTNLFVAALWRIRRDPQATPLWVNLNWPQTPTIRVQREPGHAHIALVQFQLITHRTL